MRLVANLLIGLGGCLVAGVLATNIFGLAEGPAAERRQLQLAALAFAMAALGVVASPILRPRLLRWSAASAPVSPADCVRIGVWFGLAIGVVEAAHVGLRAFGFGKFVWKPVELVWMTPLSYVLMLLPAALLMAGIAARWRRSITVPVVVFAFALFGALSQCLAYPVQRVAVAILAVGVAVQVTRFAASRAEAFLVFARRTWLWLAAAVVLAGVAVPTLRSWSEARTLSSLPPAPTGARNVVLIVLDTVRADHMSLHGYGRPTTPNIDALAARSVVFDRAFTTSSWTLESHASLFTGRYPQQTSAGWLTPLDGEHQTLAEALGQAGYATGGFVGNLGYCQRETGLARGFAHYEDYHVEPAVIGYSSEVGQRVMFRAVGHDVNELIRNDAETVTSGFLDWSAELDGRPYFAFLNYYDAHAYYIAPEGFAGKFGPPSPYVRRWYSWRNKPEARQGFIDAYDECVLYIDHQIGRLVDELEARGELDNTLLIVTGDHGELFWEHGLTEHGQCLYEPLLRAPLVLRAPGEDAARVASLATLRDLPATIVDLLGIDAVPGFPGQSMRPLWTGGRDAGSPVFSYLRQGINTPLQDANTAGDMHSLFEGSMHYIRNGDGSEELYDLAVDPGEEDNLVSKRPDVLASMRRAAAELLR